MITGNVARIRSFLTLFLFIFGGTVTAKCHSKAPNKRNIIALICWQKNFVYDYDPPRSIFKCIPSSEFETEVRQVLSDATSQNYNRESLAAFIIDRLCRETRWRVAGRSDGRITRYISIRNLWAHLSRHTRGRLSLSYCSNISFRSFVYVRIAFWFEITRPGNTEVVTVKLTFSDFLFR